MSPLITSLSLMSRKQLALLKTDVTQLAIIGNSEEGIYVINLAQEIFYDQYFVYFPSRI